MTNCLIKSLLDNDLYKFTMQQAVHALYPRAEVKYVFINRANTKFPIGFDLRLKEEIKKMEELSLSEEEYLYLKDTCYFLTPVYLEFLKYYRYNSEEVHVSIDEGELKISIEGPWFRTILWEVPLMALVSELYFSITEPDLFSLKEQHSRNIEKSIRLRDVGAQFVDFGTRRRFSADNHEQVLRDIISVPHHTFQGTSNVLFAKELGVKPIGTHAHEWFMYHAAQNGYRLANKTALDAWTQAYQGSLGIALTDTYTSDFFLNSFDSVKSRLFDGVRHDSGDPIEFTEKMLAHYKKHHIDPTTRTIVFSDGLDTDEVIRIKDYCAGKIRPSFGIGTHLTNDVGPKSLNMVIKLSKCRQDDQSQWIPVVKLSDSPGKHTGPKEEIDLCIRTITRSV
ncbi:nicotinate phosphoribosyltransferase [Spirochaeta cellobiosiphila]|uniref:nicotinate phosphoribosyltransferase n=1 Tax=Spirochaeta cellobiosiphila TaxID=504483 RepID=UPI000421F952|nr:nicotinate phosphoribosyltransferase [Spirochaeta cellobiosiphila]